MPNEFTDVLMLLAGVTDDCGPVDSLLSLSLTVPALAVDAGVAVSRAPGVAVSRAPGFFLPKKNDMVKET